MGRPPCCDKNGLKKGPWTPEEDKKLVEFIQMHGHGSWRTLPNNAGLQRCGKSCRLRWTNYLRPDIKRGRFSSEEEDMIIQMHSVIGNKWSAIAARLPGRTDNEIKNYWNTHIRKRLLQMGIDPVTHSPRLDFLDLSSLLNSSHLNVSQFLGMEPTINPDLLRLATYLLSSQRENREFTPQNVQENQLGNSQLVENHLQAQSIPLQTSSQENVLSWPTSNRCGPFMNAIMQPDAEQSLSMPIDLEPIENYVPPLDYDYLDHSTLEHLYEKSNFLTKECITRQNVTFSSGLSTPTSSPVITLNSSLTNGNSNIEDERDSYCSDHMFGFEVPRVMYQNNFM